MNIILFRQIMSIIEDMRSNKNLLKVTVMKNYKNNNAKTRTNKMTFFLLQLARIINCE